MAIRCFNCLPACPQYSVYVEKELHKEILVSLLVRWKMVRTIENVIPKTYWKHKLSHQPLQLPWTFNCVKPRRSRGRAPRHKSHRILVHFCRPDQTKLNVYRIRKLLDPWTRPEAEPNLRGPIGLVDVDRYCGKHVLSQIFKYQDNKTQPLSTTEGLGNIIILGNPHFIMTT